MKIFRTLSASSLGLLFILSFLACDDTPEDTSNVRPLQERFDPVTQSYAYPIENLPPVEFVEGVKASDCGKCHVTIYQEWQATTHASALRDIQYQSELTKEDSPRWLCLNCHIPVQNQREYFVIGLENGDVLKPVTKPNPMFDPDMQKEGITCATCHVRLDKETGKSYVIGPKGSKNAPHPLKQDREFLHNLCQRCHNPQGEAITPNLICWFETTKEVTEAAQAIIEKFGSPQDCVTCHMPETERLVADAYPQLPAKKTRQHHWVGSGVPKWYDSFDTLLERGYHPGLKVTVAQPVFHQKDSLHLAITMKNERAGHYLPTGDPERFILAVVKLLDSSGAVIARDSYRIGQTWLWSPARKIADNRLKFGESMTWRPRLPLPQRGAMKGTLVVTIYHVRLSSKSAEHIMSARNVNERYLENGNELVRNADKYYPFAAVIYQEKIKLPGFQRIVLSPQELIELSKAERDKPLDEREY